MSLAVVLVFVFVAVVRLFPLWLSGARVGVDQWTWKAIIDEMRQGSRIPVSLDKFLLDEKQWYPPFFQWLMAKLPADLYDKHASLVSIVLDLLRASLVMFAAFYLADSLGAVIIAGLVYAITPLLITYNMQLNPRGMGAVFLDVTMLAVFVMLYVGGGWGWLLILVLFSGLVLITHKMTTQLLVFMALAAAVVAAEIKYLLIVPVAVFSAMLLSGGYYRYVALAHWDIVRFWFRNWRWSGSNPVLESPIYGEPGYESPSKFYRSGWLAWWRRLSFVIGFNPWVLIAIGVSLIAFFDGLVLSPVIFFFLFWTVLIFVFSILTTLVPHLRCFGQGYLYGYNGAFPAAVLMGLFWPDLSGKWYFLLGLAGGGVASGIGLFAFFRQLLRSRTLRVDNALSLAIERLKVLPDGVVMCLPQHWHDAVAYQAQKRVLFGGHGYGFKLLQPIFPRFLVPVHELMVEHKVRYLLTYKGYCGSRFYEDLPESVVETFEDYELYIFY